MQPKLNEVQRRDAEDAEWRRDGIFREPMHCDPSESLNFEKNFAAKERKEHKKKQLCLCALCVLLRLIRFSCGSTALCSLRLCASDV